MSFFGGHDRMRSSREDRYETYREHVARHALISAASKLSLDRPVVCEEYLSTSKPRWLDWLERYDLTFPDGLWLADAKDEPPSFAEMSLLDRRDNADVLSTDPDELLQRFWLSPEIARFGVPLFAHWTSADGVWVRITSALLPKQGAIGKCKGLSKSEDHDLWLPLLEEDGHPDRFGRTTRRLGLVPWIWNREYIHVGIDEYDELACKEAAARPKLGHAVQATTGIYQADNFGRQWLTAGGGEALRTVVWGRWKGSGRECTRDDGVLLSATPGWLDSYLMSSKQVILFHLKLSKYESEYSSRPSRHLKSNLLLLRDGAGSIKAWVAKTANK